MLFFSFCTMYMNAKRDGKKITVRCYLQPFEENRKSRTPKDSLRNGILSFYLGHNIGHSKAETVIVDQ